MEPLNQYLKSLYPNASDDEIEQYISFIENNDSDRLPATAEIIEFNEKKKLLNELESRLDELKVAIIEQKNRTGHNFSLLNIRSSTRRSYDESKLYEWAADTFDPELVSNMTIKTLDIVKFKSFEAKGLLKYEELPNSVYSESDPIWTLSIIKSKK